MTPIPLALALLLTAAACGSDSTPPEDAALAHASPRASASTPGPEDGGQGEGSTEKSDARGAGEKGKRGGAKGAPRDGTGDGSSSPTADPGDGGAGGGPGGRAPGGNRKASGPRSGAARLAPAAGTYVYKQDGYEEFCAAGCSKQKLPPRQTIEATIPQRTADTAVVVTEARSSQGRSARTTTHYTAEVAGITEVHVRFSYSGYRFDQTYRPQPPVESLHFPLEPKESWRGRWTGKVSGDYAVRVVGREVVSVAGREVAATKVRTRTDFRGDFNGRANATIWIDPQTKTVLRTAGNLNVESSYGSYATGFATSLTSGPGI